MDSKKLVWYRAMLAVIGLLLVLSLIAQYVGTTYKHMRFLLDVARVLRISPLAVYGVHLIKMYIDHLARARTR